MSQKTSNRKLSKASEGPFIQTSAFRNQSRYASAFLLHFWNFAGSDYHGNGGNCSLFHLLSVLPDLSLSWTEVLLHSAFTSHKCTYAAQSALQRFAPAPSNRLRLKRLT